MDQVLFALVALERGGSFLGPAGRVQHLGEVTERVALTVEHVRLLEERGRFAR
jgi:hypothetical protein